MSHHWSAALFLLCLAHGANALGEQSDRAPQLMIDSQGFSGVRVRMMALSNDGRWLAAAGGKEVRIWNLETGQLRTTLRGYQEPPGYQIGTVRAVCFTPDGKCLIVGVSDNTALGSTRIYDMNDLTKIERLVKAQTGCTHGLAVSPDGHYVATYGCGSLFVIDLVELAHAGEKYIKCEINYNEVDSGKDYACDYFGFPVGSDWVLLREGRTLVVVSVVDRKITKDPAEWPEEIRSLLAREQKLRAHAEAASDSFTTPAEIHLDSDFWYARGGMTEDPTTDPVYWIAVWGKQSDLPRTLYTEHFFSPIAVTVNRATGIVASADVFGDIHVWEASTGKTRWQLTAKNQSIYRVAWSEDGQSLLFADQPYSQSKYNYNRFGPINRQFTLAKRQLAAADPVPDDPVSPTKTDPISGSSVSLEPVAKESSTANHGETASNYVLAMKSGEKTLARYRLTERPYAFKFAERNTQGMGRLPLFAGSFSGELYQLGLAPAETVAANSWLWGPGDASGQTEERLFMFQNFVGHSNAITSVAESPDGLLLASSSLDGTIRLWNLRRPRTVGDVDFSIAGNRVTNVMIGSAAAKAGIQLNDELLTFDGVPFYERIKRMAEGRYEAGQRVTLSIRRHGETLEKEITLKPSTDIVEPLATIFFSRDGEWVMWTQAGYYDASSRGGDYVGWHVNQARDQPARFYPVSQFTRLYRPSLINHLLRTRNLQEAIRLADAEVAHLPNAPRMRLDIRREEDFARVKPPEIRVLEPENGSVTTSRTVRVRARISASKQVPVREVEFRVNDRPAPLAYTREEEANAANGTMAAQYSQEVELRPGMNTIAIQALNTAATKATERITLNYQPAVAPGTYKPNLYTFAVGISKYANPKYNLQFAHQDAMDFTAAWKPQQGKMYNQVQAKLLVNEEATVGALRDAMEWISKSAKDPRDVAFVFLSGHAFYDEMGQWRLATYELDSQHLGRTTIGHAEISEWLDKSIHASVILFVDTCHAAGAKEVEVGDYRPPASVDIWHGSGTLVFSACMADETSVEDSEWHHGAFTEAILRGIHNRDCDINGDGKLSFTELELFVKGEVRKMTGARQNPVAEKPGTVSEVDLLSFR